MLVMLLLGVVLSQENSSHNLLTIINELFFKILKDTRFIKHHWLRNY